MVCLFQVAWSVARTSSFEDDMNPVVYPEVLVNEGNPWDPSSNSVTSPFSGYYYIYIGGAVHPFSPMYTRLWLNGIQQLGLTHEGPHQNGVETLGRSAILYMSEGDVLTVTNTHGSYSDEGRQTMFIGFLIY